MRGFVVVLSLSATASAFAQGPPPGSGQSIQITPPPQTTGQRTPTRAPGVPGGEETPTGSSVIRGFVVSLESGSPVRRAQVRVSASELRGSRIAVTDSEGRFEFRDLPAGRYRLNANKAGFVGLEYGQRRPMQPGTPIELRDKQVLEKVTIGLPRGSVIAGRITDEFGEPVADANIMAMRWQRLGGAGRWMVAGRPSRTDDLGQYRVFGLSPGEYVVSATFQGNFMMMRERVEASSEPTGFAPTYFPGVPSIGDAARITIGVGEENTNASFALFATHLAVVEGTVTTSQGTPVTQGMVSLRSDDDGVGMPMFGPGNSGPIGQGGRFRINGVAPGRYIAQVSSGRGETDEIGRMPVTVGGEKVENVSIVMMRSGRITGRVVTDTGAPLPAAPQGMGPPGLRVFANSVTPFEMNFFGSAGPDNGRVNADGSFELRGLADQRLIRFSAPPGWSVKSVLLSGRDYVDTPVQVELGQTLTGMEIVLTNRVSTVAGSVSDSQGQPVLDASILIFPDERRFWTFGSRYIRTARPDLEGRYRIENLPPFETYLAVAVQDMGEGQANDPAYLTTLQSDAARFSLREGEGATVDLKLRQ